MAVTRNKPIAGAPAQSRATLGRLLFRRREELGFGDSRPRFYRATGVNRRFADDIENARRSNFEEPWLRMAARGYAVTYESLVDVAWGRADELVPAVSANAGLATAAGQALPPSAAPVPGLPPAPAPSLLREDDARPYAAVLWNRLMRLAARGVPDPDGRHPRDWDPDDWDSWNPSAEQLGLSGQDADTWNGSRCAMSLADRAWLTGDWHARRAARNPARDAGATSA